MVRRVFLIAAFVGVLQGAAAWGQGVGGDELAPLPSARELATGMAVRLAERQRDWPSSRTREVFREYRRWLAFLGRNGLEGEFAEEVRARSDRMAEILDGRFGELVAECREGNATVVTQMRELVDMASRYPALVQNLGAPWFERAEAEMRRCGVPNWYGVASAGQADAFVSGYFGSVEVTWVLDDVQGETAAYVPVVDFVSFVIPSAPCEVYTVESVVPNLADSSLEVDFGTTPATYRALLMVDVTFTYTDPCERPAPPAMRFTSAFPIVFPTELGVLGGADEHIDGTYEDRDTEYLSRWFFERVERE